MPTEYHIVHKESLERVASGKKMAEEEQRQKARFILKHIQERLAGEQVVLIANPSRLDHVPDEGTDVVIGGAFDDQCLLDYEETLRRNNITFRRDEALILK